METQRLDPQRSMAAFPHRRQLALFVVAVLFPSMVLVALGLRTIVQDRELAANRLAEDRRRLVADVRQALRAELDGIKLDALRDYAKTTESPSSRAYGHPAVRLVAPIREGRFVAPWELRRANPVAQASLEPHSLAFMRAIARGEVAELREKDFPRATSAYRDALRASTNPPQSAFARLMLARALAAGGRFGEALKLYRDLLAMPSEIQDAEGVPIALYAAARLIESAPPDSLVGARLRLELASSVWRSPAEAYLLRGLVDRIAAKDSSGQRISASRPRIDDEIALIERTIALQHELPRIGLAYGGGLSSAAPVAWVPFASGAWLVTVADSPGADGEAVVAVDAQTVLRAMSNSAASPSSLPSTLAFRLGDEGEPLGPDFPYFMLARGDTPSATLGTALNRQRRFYLAILTLVLGITVVGGYLLWRDVRREARLSDLRAHFVSSVSHELKTPLTAIRMFAERLRAKEHPTRAMLAEYLDTIVGESERLTRLLNNVLDLSRIEQDQKNYRREPTALAIVAKRAAAAMEYPLAQEGFTLNVQLENGVPPIAVDADAIEQAILNLLTNAMKYSGDSRVIDLRVRPENGHAVIDVADRGVGIPSSEHTRLTERFYRVRSAANDRISGTGLGLTLVDHVVRAHGGFLHVQSVVGEGSTFSIHLPLETRS